jgi:hypothetical protein
MRNYNCIAVCLATLLLAVFFVSPCFAVDADEASGIINQAELELKSAFANVDEAEGAGADIFVLLNRLNMAGDFLSKAYGAFRANDYESASFFATECINATEGLSDEATRLKVDAENARNDLILSTALGSGVGVSLLLIVGLLVWKSLKKGISHQFSSDNLSGEPQ